MNYIEINKQAYDRAAEEYLERAKNKSNFEEPLENLVGTPLRLAKQRFDKINVLEIGPGSGEVCAYLELKGCQTTAVDFSERILGVVKIISPKTKRINEDILQSELPEDKYQIIYCGALIHLFKKEDAERLMKKINKSLSKKGILFMNTTIHEKSDEGFYEKQDYQSRVKRFRHKYTEEEFRELIESSNFRILDRITTDEQNREKFWVAYISEKQ